MTLAALAPAPTRPASPSFSLHGRVALVTGCNTGLGQAMAIALAAAGADIVGVNRSAPEATREQVESLGRRFLGLHHDLGQRGGTEACVDQAHELAGHVDILVNNAGVIRRADALDVTEDDWDRVIEVNLTAGFRLAQAMARRCVAAGRGGKIINVASMLSFQGGVRVAAYTASKSAILGLTRALANEWAGRGIQVNAIAPGYMVTNNTVALRADAARNRAILERIPAGRWGEPADLAGPVVFLASGASDYMNGCTIAVDGGWLAR